MVKGHLTNASGRHLSESNFSRFSEHFERLLETYPEPLTLTPASLSLPTFIAQLRNAANAYITYHYPSLLDYDKFVLVWNATTCRPVGDSVVISPKKSTLPDADVTAPTKAYYLVLTSPTGPQLLAAANLILTGITAGPILIEGALPFVTLDPSLFLQEQPGGSHILL